MKRKEGKRSKKEQLTKGREEERTTGIKWEKDNRKCRTSDGRIDKE
jgi:hypothetical protein